MDAIKITRGRTRRSQGAGDALGGPSPAAAGGVGEGGETLRGRRSRCRLCPGGGGRGRRGPAAGRGPAPRAAPGRRSWRGGEGDTAAAPGRRRQRERRGGKRPQKAAGPPQSRPLEGPTARAAAWAENRSAAPTPRGAPGRPPAPRAGQGPAVRPRGSCPTELLLRRRLERPSADARREICPGVCPDRFLRPRRAGTWPRWEKAGGGSPPPAREARRWWNKPLQTLLLPLIAHLSSHGDGKK